MAITAVGHIGNGPNTVSATSFSFLSSAALEAGNIGILLVAADNVGTTDATETNEVTSVSDQDGNTWTKIAENRYAEGAAAAGAVCSIFKTKVTTTIASTRLITVNFASAVTAKVATVFAFSVGAGNDLALVAGSVQYTTHNSADPTSATIASLPSQEYLFVRAVAGETNSTTALTPTSGYAAFTGVQTGSGGAAANVAVRGEYDIVTATGSTSDPTWVATDGCALLVAFQETSPSAPAYDQDSFRFRNNDGSETTATWAAALNTNATLNVNTTYRLRQLVQNTGTGPGTDVDLEWQYNLASAGWNNITTSSSVVRAVSSGNFTNGDDCTQQLGTGTFYSNNDGMSEDGTAGGVNLDLTNGQEIETELSFQMLSAGVVEFRVTRDGGTVLDSYTRIPVATAVGGVNIPAIESAVFRRLHGRVFSFVN